MVSEDEGWVVGFDLAPLRSVVLPIRDGVVGAALGTACSVLLDVQMVDDRTGWAGGAQSSGMSSASCILRWSGASWERVSSPGAALVVALSMTGPDEGWAFGTEGQLLERAGGAWVERPSPVVPGAFTVTDGALSRAGFGWAVGTLAGAMRLDGATWELASVGHAVELLGLDMVSDQAGWAVGRTEFQWPVILRFDGSAWHEETLPDLGPLRQLTAVDMVSATDGWAVGGATALRYYVDPRTPSPTPQPTETATPTDAPTASTTAPGPTPDAGGAAFLPWAWRR
jgi:hypothetical protein